MRFTDMHAGASVCTPARSAILTGRLGPRTGVIYNFGEASLYGLNRTEPVLAELLSDQLGYDTMAIGKWHLGHSHDYNPTSRGFDNFYGVPYSWDMGCSDGTNGDQWYDGVCSSCPESGPCQRYGCPTWWGDKNAARGCAAQTPGIALFDDYTIIEQPANLSTLTLRFTREAVDFIMDHAIDHAAAPSVDTGAGAGTDQSKGKGAADGTTSFLRRADAPGVAGEGERAASPNPFFLYYPSTHMHAPMAHLPMFTGSSSKRGSIYADTLRELDASVGAIVDAVEDAGLSENTLIIVSSDNGPWNIKVSI